MGGSILVNARDSWERGPANGPSPVQRRLYRGDAPTGTTKLNTKKVPPNDETS